MDESHSGALRFQLATLELPALDVNVQPRITIYLRNVSNVKEKNKQKKKKKKKEGPIKHRDNAEENKNLYLISSEQ